MTVTVIYPKEVSFPFNIPCLSIDDKVLCAEMIAQALMGNGFETETATSKKFNVRAMCSGDLIMFPDGETWAVTKKDFIVLNRRDMIDYQKRPFYSYN
jgi:hypothetical protein